jgi:CO/xanthine dehydrogenase Mo-binding subunit
MTLLLQRVVKGKIMTTQNNLLENDSRRQFIVKGTLLGGGLMLGIGALPDLAYAQIDQKYDPNTPTKVGDSEVNAWVSILPDETVFIRIARSEMGQGTRTGLAQLVTEELECSWKKVKTQSATPGQSLARKRVWGEHGTGGSRGIRISEDYVRRGAAAAGRHAVHPARAASGAAADRGASALGRAPALVAAGRAAAGRHCRTRRRRAHGAHPAPPAAPEEGRRPRNASFARPHHRGRDGPEK